MFLGSPLGPTKIVPQQISFLFQNERSMKSETLESASSPLAEVSWEPPSERTASSDEIELLSLF